jgi:MarR family transcriptional regulator for hemolysin
MPADLENDLLLLLSEAARHMRTYADHLMQAHGTTRARATILAQLERRPDLSQKELAAIAEVSPVTITRLIDRLETLGLVERCADPADRRVRRLRITPEAAEPLRLITDFRANVLSVVTKGIEPAVLEAMAFGLRRMKENLSDRRSSEEKNKDRCSIHKS